ncbi:hypothetical protein THAOC_28706 [Thalassiosira oceanica]|uniref:Uncharacterized protein n=1 Tax=Thalassiosira oceanica TaxID=159749 RepID=K0RIG2_THAOC|nr:hypothetical protein THAOC_28706 [Thalassiosira oceanica]|eukprot:EJK52064.1 hypothetical protein THAOC_28706 [Thalassiosira oceanica]
MFANRAVEHPPNGGCLGCSIARFCELPFPATAPFIGRRREAVKDDIPQRTQTTGKKASERGVFAKPTLWNCQLQVEEERLVKLAGLDICDLFYPVALMFQVIYLLLHVVEFTIGSVGNVGEVASRSSLEGGGVIEVIGNVQALTTMSSVWSAASSLWGGGVPSCGLGPLRVFLFGVEAQFSTGGWNSVFVIGLLLFGCIRAGLHLFEFTHPNRYSPQKKRKKKRGKCNRRRRVKKFHRRRLHVNLVKRCRRRVGNRPPRLDGSRFRSPRGSKHTRWKRRKARQRFHWEKASLAKELWEFCGSPRPNPTHVDAPVWEPLLNWFHFESDFADDFPAYVLDAEERIKWKEYLDKFIATEDHVENVKRLEARAKRARDSMHGNRGSKTRSSRRNTCPSTSLWTRVLSYGRCSRLSSVVGRLALATGSTYLGFYLSSGFFRGKHIDK